MFPKKQNPCISLWVVSATLLDLNANRCRCLTTDRGRCTSLIPADDWPLTCPKQNCGRGCSPLSCPGRKSSSQCQCPLTSWRAYLESHKCKGEHKKMVNSNTLRSILPWFHMVLRTVKSNLHVKVPLPLIPANGFSWKRTCNPIFAASLFMTLASFSPYGAGRSKHRTEPRVLCERSLVIFCIVLVYLSSSFTLEVQRPNFAHW